MTRWAGTLFLLLLAATAPLLAPTTWRDAGRWPDLAVLAVVFLGFRGTPDRAAMFGIAVGLVASLWTPEPLLFRPFVLGSVGYVAGHAASILHRDHVVVRLVAAAAGVVAMRLAEQIAAALSAGSAAPWTGYDAARVASVTFTAAVATGLAMPVYFAVAKRWRLLAPLERSFRDV
ncbi:MAG: hypothetical protein K8T90_01815 [Planctomycetes bacterium]|nr:hypothetical protein [Planctomycetota bacterium]